MNFKTCFAQWICFALALGLLVSCTPSEESAQSAQSLSAQPALEAVEKPIALSAKGQEDSGGGVLGSNQADGGIDSASEKDLSHLDDAEKKISPNEPQSMSVISDTDEAVDLEETGQMNQDSKRQAYTDAELGFSFEFDVDVYLISVRDADIEREFAIKQWLVVEKRFADDPLTVPTFSVFAYDNVVVEVALDGWLKARLGYGDESQWMVSDYRHPVHGWDGIKVQSLNFINPGEFIYVLTGDTILEIVFSGEAGQKMVNSFMVTK